MPVVATQISSASLVVGQWYVGRGRNGNVGLWDGNHFLLISEKLGEQVIKRERYFTADSGTFQPFLEVNEGRMIEPFGKTAWDAHYGSKMEFPS